MTPSTVAPNRYHKWRRAPRSLFSTFVCAICGGASMVKHYGRCPGMANNRQVALGSRLRVTPITLREANAYVAANHRHHGETCGCIVVCACSDERDEIRGVGIVGRPVARLLQDGYTAEVTRLCTDGAPNACSMLYRALWRAVRALGYRRLVTYTLPQEGGTSLRAAGFRLIGEAGGGTWDRPASGRPRIDLHPTQEKLRWELCA